MDIEKLSKSQIVLLTILVSFVSSVATGIVTVSLMEQAPPAITQTVNRIVERTIETVASESQAASPATTIVEKSVIVREGELIARAVKGIEPSIVRLFTPGRDDAGRDIQLFVGIAVVANASGTLIADAGTPTDRLTGLRSDGVRVPLTLLERKDGAKTITLQAPSEAEVAVEEGRIETKAISWTAASFGKSAVQLGETIVVIGGRDATKVATGIISSADTGKNTLTADVAADAYGAGSPLLNVDGQVIGIATRELREAGGGFLASGAFVLDNTPPEGGN